MTTTATVGYPDFEDLVHQVRTNDSAIMDRILEPDGHFQTRRTTLTEITRAVTELNAEGFRNRSSEDLPTIIFGWGKCRVGSTALTNLFGIAGVLAYYNPIKTAVRHFALDSQGDPWDLPQRAQQNIVFSKNMSGPYHLADCMVNSLQILVEAGYPVSRIHLLVLDRDPYRSLDSWLNIWGHMIAPERLVQHYVLSALNSVRMKTYARSVGVPVLHYIYEASRMPDNVIGRVFRRLGIEQHGDVVGNWNEKGALESSRSKIIFPKLPKAIEHIPGMHASETRYLYKERSADRISIEHRRLIEESGVIDCYREAAFGCANELQLNLFDRRKLFENTPMEVTAPTVPVGIEVPQTAYASEPSPQRGIRPAPGRDRN